jgi:hypothetical protein
MHAVRLSRLWLELALALVLLLASRAARADDAAVPPSPWWFAGGVGIARMESGHSAPVESGQTGFNWTLAAGGRLRPTWGLGVEVGSNMVESFFGCNSGPCLATRDDLARGKEFDHFLLVTEWRPHADGGWLLHGGAGLMQYCYGQNAFSECHTLSTPGISLAAGYDWPVGASMRVGLRLGMEYASFPSKPAAGIDSFQYSAARLTLQLTSF